jgi:tRNA-specific 2-thiouridylase
MSASAVVLLTGSLDSRLAARVLQTQGLQVVGLFHRAACQPHTQPAEQAAHELGIGLIVVEQNQAYVELLRNPRHGYGRGMNPCLDCRIHICRLAREQMQRIGAQFVASGEVLGQKPLTQKRRDLELVAHASALGDRLLRPLSALRLTPTDPERSGLVDRQRLHDFSGRGRKPQIALARELGLNWSGEMLPGCLLAEAPCAAQLAALFEREPTPQAWDFALLGLGRHLPLLERATIVIGRNAAENGRLEELFLSADSREAALLVPADFAGPTALLVGSADQRAEQQALVAVAAGSKHPTPGAAVRLTRNGQADRALRLPEMS